MVAEDGNLADPTTTAQMVTRRLGPNQDIEVGPEIGRGGFGTVHDGFHSTLKRRVAIKFLHPEKIESSREIVDSSGKRTRELVSRFEREIAIGKELADSRFVELVDSGVERLEDGKELHWFAMEFVEDPNLQQLLETEGKLPPLEACQLVRELARALKIAHDKGLAHRDVKPSNIFVTRTETRISCKLADFGLAKIETEDEDLTRTGQVMATIRYAPPEQIFGIKSLVGEKADIWALGAVLWQLVTGKLPWHDQDSQGKIFDAHRKGLTLPNARTENAELGERVGEAELCDLINRMVSSGEEYVPYESRARSQHSSRLTGRAIAETVSATGQSSTIELTAMPDPAVRPAADEIIDELTKLIENRDAFETRTSYGRRMRRQRIWQKSRWGLLTVVLLAVAGTGSYWFATLPPAPAEVRLPQVFAEFGHTEVDIDERKWDEVSVSRDLRNPPAPGTLVCWTNDTQQIFGLKFDSAGITNLEPLNRVGNALVHVNVGTHVEQAKGTSLDISGCIFPNLLGLECNNRLIDLKQLIEAFPKLTRLSIRRSGVVDLSPLSSLTELEFLDVSETEVSDTDLQVLGETTTLRELHLRNCKNVRTLGWLKNLTRLKVFQCVGCPIPEDEAQWVNGEKDIEVWAEGRLGVRIAERYPEAEITAFPVDIVLQKEDADQELQE